jgi:hypothetical protein
MSAHSRQPESEKPAIPSEQPSAPEHEPQVAGSDEVQDPDALLELWLDQIRAAERRAERETAAIRVR